MYKNKKILAIIPARGGSKRVKGKNIRPMNHKPLIAHTIEAALACGMFDKVICTTDDRQIALIAKKYGAEVPFMRPKKLASDKAVGWQVLQHAVKTLSDKESYEPDFAVSLSVCAPLRNKQDIKRSVDKFIDKKANFVRSAVQSDSNPYFNLVEIKNGKACLSKSSKNAVTQAQKAPKVYRVNDSINVVDIDFLFKHNVLTYDKKTYIVEMPPERSVDIDEELDFRMAELLMKKS